MTSLIKTANRSVEIEGDQTINGQKTFEDAVVFNGSPIILTGDIQTNGGSSNRDNIDDVADEDKIPELSLGKPTKITIDRLQRYSPLCNKSDRSANADPLYFFILSDDNSIYKLKLTEGINTSVDHEQSSYSYDKIYLPSYVSDILCMSEKDNLNVPDVLDASGRFYNFYDQDGTHFSPLCVNTFDGDIKGRKIAQVAVLDSTLSLVLDEYGNVFTYDYSHSDRHYYPKVNLYKNDYIKYKKIVDMVSDKLLSIVYLLDEYGQVHILRGSDLKPGVMTSKMVGAPNSIVNQKIASIAVRNRSVLVAETLTNKVDINGEVTRYLDQYRFMAITENGALYNRDELVAEKSPNSKKFTKFVRNATGDDIVILDEDGKTYFYAINDNNQSIKHVSDVIPNSIVDFYSRDSGFMNQDTHYLDTSIGMVEHTEVENKLQNDELRYIILQNYTNQDGDIDVEYGLFVMSNGDIYYLIRHGVDIDDNKYYAKVFFRVTDFQAKIHN